MTNPPKPITVRLDNIESKIDELIKTMSIQDSSNVDIDSIKEDLYKQMSLSMKEISSIPLEWITMINYCIKNDIKIGTVFEVVKILNRDF